MIIFRDIISGDEMFSDAFKYKESECGFFYEVDGKRVSRTEGFDDSLISANASAEDPLDSTEAALITGVDIVLNHGLRETPAYDKKAYMAHIKDYVKALKAKLEESNPDRVTPFTTGAPAVIKKIVANLKNYEFFTGESMNSEGMVALLDYHEDGVTPFMIFFKDGLIEEKC